MSKPWFDSETGVLLFDRYVAEMPSFQKIMADEVVTDAELAEQSLKVAQLLMELDAMLSPEEKALVTDTLCELAVLHSLHVKHLESR